MTAATEKQPEPLGEGEDVTASVCGLARVSPLLAEALRRRSVEGAKKYGTVLRTNNGRDARVDCYQEVLDGIVYAHQRVLVLGIEPRHAMERLRWREVRDELISLAERLRRWL